MTAVDANTVLLTISLGLSAWALKTLHGVAVTQAAQKERSDDNHDRLVAIDTRLQYVEQDVATLKARDA